MSLVNPINGEIQYINGRNMKYNSAKGIRENVNVQATISARDLPPTRGGKLNDNYILLENSNGTKTRHVNTDANRKKGAEQQAKRNEQAVLDYEKKQAESEKTNNTQNNNGNNKSKSRNRSNTVRNSAAIKQPEPTYVDQNGVTHTGMTQDEFNQSMQMYEADNQGGYEHQRNQTLPGGSTRGEIFDQAVEKFLANPDSFNDSQKQALIKVGQQLGYFNGSSAAAPDQTETQTVTDTVTTAPTVQPTVTSTSTQRQVNSAHDAYYAPQNSPWGITL